MEYDLGDAALGSDIAADDVLQFKFCRDEVDAGDTMADEALLIDLQFEYDE